MRPKHETYGEGFISERSVTLWSGIAQVREPLDTLYFGDRVEIVARHNDNAKVRTAGGTIGWIDARMLMDPTLWKRSAALLDEAQALPVQARGRTKVATNLRVQPGRSQPRLYQFGRGIPVEIVGRAVADAMPPAPAAPAAPDEKEKEPPPAAAEPGAESKKEEWFFIRALASRPPGEANVKITDPNTTTRPGDQTIPIAGWIVGRFVELDLPDTVKEGANSANIRPLAWFELTKVPDPSGPKPEYLVAAARGPDSQPCDFTILRVYTWNPRKSRYETAFIENNLCGQLPIRVGKSPKAEPEFRFRAKDDPNEDRVYRLMQTVVRRIREGGSVVPAPKKSGSKPGRAPKSASKAKTRKKS
jgi:hypothetical protein